jgi:hypothetical protein
MPAAHCRSARHHVSRLFGRFNGSKLILTPSILAQGAVQARLPGRPLQGMITMSDANCLIVRASGRQLDDLRSEASRIAKASTGGSSETIKARPFALKILSRKRGSPPSVRTLASLIGMAERILHFAKADVRPHFGAALRNQNATPVWH